MCCCCPAADLQVVCDNARHFLDEHTIQRASVSYRSGMEPRTVCTQQKSRDSVTKNQAKQAVTGDLALTGMKKWLADYRAKRQGLSTLQAKVDVLIAEFEAREKKAFQEKLAAAEEDGWTLIVGNKGRKKTADSHSSIRVEAVSTTAATEKATKKSKKEAFVDFYRFQKRESRRSDVFQLQQKFLEDKARIAKMREARKFRPY